MIGFIAFLFVASGATVLAMNALVIAYPFARDLSWYLQCLAGALWLAVGVGLFLRKPLARLLALGMLLLGSFTFVTVPGVMLLLLGGIEGLAQMLAVVWLVVPGASWALQLLGNLTAVSIAAMVTLVVISLVFFALYRQLRREQVTLQFGEHRWMGTLPGLRDERSKVYAIAILWGLILFLGPLVEGAERVQRSAEKRAYDLERYQRDLVEQLHFAADGKSLMVASDAGWPELFAIDLSSGAVVKKDPQIYTMHGQEERDRLSALMSEDNAMFFARGEQGIGITDLRTDQTRWLAGPSDLGVVPIGFGKDPGRYLLWRRAYVLGGTRKGGTLELVDFASQQVVYSVPASKSEWLTDDAVSNKLPWAIAKGALSPLRDSFAFVFHGHLHVVSTATGALTVVEETLEACDQIAYSVEGTFITVSGYGACADAVLFYDLESGTTLRRPVHGEVLYMSSARDALIVREPRGGFEASLTDPAVLRWRIAQADGVRLRAVTADGAFLVVTKGATQALEAVDLESLRAGPPIAYRALEVRMNPTDSPYGVGYQVVAQAPYLVLIDSPRIEIIKQTAIAGSGEPSLLLDLATVRQ